MKHVIVPNIRGLIANGSEPLTEDSLPGIFSTTSITNGILYSSKKCTLEIPNASEIKYHHTQKPPNMIADVWIESDIDISAFDSTKYVSFEDFAKENHEAKRRQEKRKLQQLLHK
jgi:hypothetical protein